MVKGLIILTSIHLTKVDPLKKDAIDDLFSENKELAIYASLYGRFPFLASYMAWSAALSRVSESSPFFGKVLIPIEAVTT
jgi:hypothetical protein